MEEDNDYLPPSAVGRRLVEHVMVMWRWVLKVGRVAVSTLSAVERGSCVVRGAWEPDEVTRVLRRNDSVFVCVGARESMCILVVMLL